MRQQLNIDSLGDLDNGSARAIVNASINSAVTDLDDRGDDGKPRTVTITLTLLKMKNGHTDISVAAKASVPTYRSNSTLARPKIEGKKTVLEFQATAPENPDQATMDFEDSEA